MDTLRKVGVLAHPYRPATAPLAQSVGESLRARGLDVWVLTAWDAEKASPLIDGSDLVIAIGGDGAMLRSARVCSSLGVPILGLNAGYLGFLAELSPDAWPQALERLLDGDCWLETRMMIGCEVWHDGQKIAQADALNDIVVSRGAVARSVHLEAYINNTWTSTYNADGLIIATPTGSTAYALAVGGPLLPPELRNILIVPVAPHLSMERPLVLPENAEVKVVVMPRSFEPEVVVTVDGELMATMTAHDHIIIRASEKTADFVRLRERGYFFRSILDRLEPRLAAQYQPQDKEQR